jgi:hypothetical protein
MPKTAVAAAPKTLNNDRKRKYLSQGDVPSCSLDKALEIAKAIADNYGYGPATPVQVAAALEVQPSSGPFRMLAGASIAYGLTKGGYNAPTISIEPLGMRIVRPTKEDDDKAAKREALLRPRVIRLFLEKYNGAAIPKETIAENVLIDMDVPKDRAAEVLKLIVEGAGAVGFLADINGRKYVDLLGTKIPAPTLGPEDEQTEEQLREEPLGKPALAVVPVPAREPGTAAPTDFRTRRCISATARTGRSLSRSRNS